MIFKAARFVPLMVARRQIGWLRPELAARLAAWPEIFASSAEKVVLLKPEALSGVVEDLAREGFIPGWRNERYRIADLLDIERAAARPFGLTTAAVHLNGIAFGAGHMWIARRSATKPIDPGMLDNLVGGGIASGISVQQTLIKEAWEEAGIPAELARAATRGGTVEILREVPEGVQSETLSVYDLVLPEGFEPKNQDGEVAGFQCLPFTEVLRLLEQPGQFTLDAGLVAKDYFKRAGL
jgi:8-oxo-dGTP pyrophosphatase MutT (NUDIX family)